ncbi:MAG: exonuclease domain-containing protein [Ferruginibacter sp.]
MYAIVDIETTGGYASASRITEIAIYVHDGERVVRHFESLVNPEQSIPRYITALTGIDDDMVEDAPVFDAIAETVYDILKDTVFVAHNVNFDFSFIKHQLQLSGLNLSVPKLCTVRLGRKIFPGLPSYSLGKLCQSLHIPIEDRHRAGGDAKATVLLWEHYLAHGGMEDIDKMLKRTSGEQWLPLQLQKDAINNLPTSPGVYYFHDEKDKVIYVGKAVNIKKRVSSHFTHHDAGNKRQQFLRLIRRISYQSCATELEAIVLESAEIKKRWPKYNYSQKQATNRFALYCYEDNKGYKRLAIDKLKKNIPPIYRFNLLREGQAMMRKLADAYELHYKLCFMDKGPIDDTEWEMIGEPQQYNQRVEQALAALEIDLPTFAVIDEGPDETQRLCLLIERGCFWGMGYLPQSMQNYTSDEIKLFLNPMHDNDTIRHSIYSFVQIHPEKRIALTA